MCSSANIARGYEIHVWRMRNGSMGLSNRTIKGKHVVVTGGAGFIGSHLVDLLIAEGVGKLTINDNFFLGKASNLQEACDEMPELQVTAIYGADDHAVRALF